MSVLIRIIAFLCTVITQIVLTNYCQSNGGDTAHITGIKCLERLIGKKQIVDKKLTRKEELYNI